MQFSEVVKILFNDINTNVLPEHLTFGKPKQESRKRLPSSLSLDGKYIAEIDFDDEVFEIVENIKAIHLNNNVIRSWDDVILLLQNIPSLESLNLSSNPLALYQNIGLSKDYLFSTLKVLILNETQARWEIILHLLEHIPSLEVLHLSMNKQTLTKSAFDTSSSQVFSNLRELFYSSNNCSEIDELILIGDLFPSIENLVLLNNGLVTLLPSDFENEDSFLHCHFLNLTSLSISNNLLDDWKSIDYISNFQKLTDLKVAGQPLYENLLQEDVWNELVTRLDNVNKLNGSIINEDTRNKAQRGFMRYYLNYEKRPPKFEELRKIHGDIAPLIDIDLSPRNIIETKVTCGDASIEVSVDVRNTVGKLKKTWCQKFGIKDSSIYNLLYWDHEVYSAHGPERLNYPKRKLLAYNINPNDWFSLDLKTM